ncbi:hypothetical protein BCR42DRAFT_315307 [Absidia repens]|uniref:Uncharacterized protein n=1 Tax=Absidia repens TaxID=90262 RepID=A0A1X2J277_9FUNG|nr:hypothetical protein BCR42DRAFT_315307 [Absidia repens]
MSPPSVHDTNTSTLLCFLTGVAIAVMGYSLYSHVEELQQRPDSTRKRHGGLESDKKLEDAISLKALVYLIQSSNAAIQSNSVKITIERAMSGKKRRRGSSIVSNGY